jgi:hypothetical protein
MERGEWVIREGMGAYMNNKATTTTKKEGSNILLCWHRLSGLMSKG